MSTTTRCIPLVLCVLMACQESKPTNEDVVRSSQDSTAMLPPDDKIKECYESKIGNSSVNLSLTGSGNLVEGRLDYLHDEKDNNKGRLKGRIMGDTLLADYTFMSEGVESVREVIFLKTTAGYREGYGAVKDEAGKMIFEDRKQVDFSKSAELVKVDCNSGKL